MRVRRCGEENGEGGVRNNSWTSGLHFSDLGKSIKHIDVQAICAPTTSMPYKGLECLLNRGWTKMQEISDNGCLEWDDGGVFSVLFLFLFCFFFFFFFLKQGYTISPIRVKLFLLRNDGCICVCSVYLTALRLLCVHKPPPSLPGLQA